VYNGQLGTFSLHQDTSSASSSNPIVTVAIVVAAEALAVASIPLCSSLALFLPLRPSNARSVLRRVAAFPFSVLGPFYTVSFGPDSLILLEKERERERHTHTQSSFSLSL